MKKIEEGDNIKASLFGFFIGDALGVPVEFQSRPYLKDHPVIDMREHGTHNQPKGTWSDDSSMVIATIDAILKSRDKIDYLLIMENFLEWKQNGKFTPFQEVFDIGNATWEALRNFETEKNYLTCGNKDVFSNGNGSLMRILPVSLYLYYSKIEGSEYKEIIKIISSMTHAHSYSIISCFIYSVFISNLIEEKDKRKAFEKTRLMLLQEREDASVLKEVFDRLLKRDFASLKEEEIASSGYVVDSLEASIWCLLNTDSFESAVLKAVNLGNDTDTIGALTGALAGILYGYDAIPENWLKSLQRKEYLNEITDSFTICLKKKSIEKGEKMMDLKILEETIKDLETNPEACMLREENGYGSIAGAQLNTFIQYLIDNNQMDKEYLEKDIQKEIEEMTMEEVLTSLTKIIRSERFVAGEMYFKFKDQTLVKLIKRLYDLSK